MLDRLSPRQLLLSLLCVALFGARVGGAHLHLCFDDSEPAVGAHIDAEASHHADHHDGTHDDLDISLVGDALAKPGKSLFDTPVLLPAAFWVTALLAQALQIPAGEPARLLASVTHFLRPPLRGPPPISR